MTDHRTRPFTGAEYIDSIRDGREIWIYGERVKDVTEHPAFRNPARMTARLYDALHDPATKDTITVTSRPHTTPRRRALCMLLPFCRGARSHRSTTSERPAG